MIRLFIISAICFSTQLFSQKISGIVVDEDDKALPAVLVLNVKTEEKVYTNFSGEFTIQASAHQELRFIRKGYERISLQIDEKDFQNSMKISLTKLAEEIEEVEIIRKPTGDLKKDANLFGDTKSTAKLKSETAGYIRSNSTEEVLAPKTGEFVQPIGQGFTMGSINSQWDDVDFMKFLIQNIDKEFFIDDLKLQPSEIQTFIFYIFRNFERNEILFYGICPHFDLVRFIEEAQKKADAYRKNLPNNPPKKKKKR